MRDWDSDDFYAMSGPGEVWDKPREFNGTKVIPNALGEHVCGTAEDFANGATFDPLRPPVTYYTNGLPTCCGTPPLVTGFKFGGTANVQSVYRPAASGGFLFGGTASVKLYCNTYAITHPTFGVIPLSNVVLDQVWRNTPVAPLWQLASPKVTGVPGSWVVVKTSGAGAGQWGFTSWSGRGSSNNTSKVPATLPNISVACTD